MGADALTHVRDRPAAKSRVWLAVTLLLAGLALAGVAQRAVRELGSLAGALAFLNGDRLIPDAYTKSFGTAQAGPSASVVFNLANKSTRPIKIMGSRSSCTCMALDGLPAVVQAGSSLQLKVQVRPTARQRLVTGVVMLYPDYEGQPYVSLRVSGQFADPGQLERSATGAKP